MEQFLELFLEDLVGPLLGFDVVFMRLLIGLLLLLIVDLHISDFLLELPHLIFQFFGLILQIADLVLHVLLLLLSLEGPPHAKRDRRLIQSLIGLDSLHQMQRVLI